MKRLLLPLLFLLAPLAVAQTALTDTNVKTVTGAKTFSGTCKLKLAGSTSGTTCLQAPAIAGSTTAIVFPDAPGTLATLAGTETLTNKSIAVSQLTGNLAIARFNSGTSASSTTFWRGDGVWAVAGTGDVVGPGSATDGHLALFDGATGKLIKDGGAPAAGGITALTGDVTASGTGSVAATIANNAVTNAKAAQMAAHTYKGNNTGSTANSIDLTATQLTAELNVAVGDAGAGGTKGLAPAAGAGDAAAGKYLKADMTYAVPPGSAGAGALVLLESYTASNSATIDFTTRNAAGQSGATFQSDYDDYVLKIVGLVAGTDATSLYLRVGTGGGPTYVTTTYIDTNYQTNQAGGSAIGTSLGSAIPLASSLGNAAANSANGTIEIFSPSNATLHKRFNYDFSGGQSSGNYHQLRGTASYPSATALTALRILMSAGNIASGFLRLYGVAK